MSATKTPMEQSSKSPATEAVKSTQPATIPAATTVPVKNPEKKPKKARHSTKHYRVNIDRAETLSGTFPSLSTVEIRECLEGAPLKQAVGLINWAERCGPLDPYKPLRNWAKKNRCGFYSQKVKQIDNNEHYLRCMLYIRRKEEKMLTDQGRGLFQKEREQLAQLYYAPRYRAETTEALSYASSEQRQAG